MSTYGLDAKNILKLDKGATNTLTIFPGGSGDEDIVALDDKDILQLNVPADVLTIFPGGADDTIALDDKPILGLTLGATVLTLFPDGTTERVAIKPDPPLAAATGAGDIIYRASDGTGTLAKVDVQLPVTFSSTGVLSCDLEHVGVTSSDTMGQETRTPNRVHQNMTLATLGRVGLNFITRNDTDRTCYLPGGDWTEAGSATNEPPLVPPIGGEKLNSFQFLAVTANMTAIDPSLVEQTVYVPCYYYKAP